MTKKNTALVFPGQGSQFVGMGKDLYDNFSSAKKVFETVDDVLKIKLSKIIFEGPAEELTKTENTQLALMAVSIAIMEVLEKEFGKKIEDICGMVAGHSLGEYSALCAAKAITLEETAKLLQVRGRAMAECGKKSKGAMAAIIGTTIDVVHEIASLAAANGEVCQVANDNSSAQVVISGTENAINKALEIAKEKGVKRAIALPVSGAFHSSLMNDAKVEMQVALEKAHIKSPSIPLIANVTANFVADENQIKNLLVQQITGSVRWRETLIFMEQNGITEIMEVGAGKVLSGLVGRTCSANVTSKSIQTIEEIAAFADRS